MAGNKGDMVWGEGLCELLLSVGGKSELYGRKMVQVSRVCGLYHAQGEDKMTWREEHLAGLWVKAYRGTCA